MRSVDMSPHVHASQRAAMLKSLGLLFFLFVCLNAHPTSWTRIKRDTDAKINTKWNATNADKLKRDLLLNYDKFTRPSQSGNATVVHFDPSIHHIELDEEKSIIQVYCYIKMSWTDEKLRWNEEDYGGLTDLHLADHEVWQPDVVPYNGATGSSIDQYGNTQCIVSNRGLVVWVPPAVLQVFCEIDLTKWPFDTQMCMIKVGSWTHDGTQIDLQHSSDDITLTNILPNAQWRLISITKQRNVVHYACCKEPYVDLMFNVTMARQSPTYKTLIVTPITVIVLMTLATFWLPTTSSDKIYLGGTTAIVIALFLIYFIQKLAVASGNTPLIVYFYSSSLYLVGFSIVISVAVMNLSNGPRSRPVPWSIKSLLTGWLGRLLLLQNLTQQVSGLQSSMAKSSGEDDTADNRPVFASEGQDMPEGQGNGGCAKAIQRDWRLVAVAVDRIAFLFYCFLFICFAIAYSI